MQPMIRWWVLHDVLSLSIEFHKKKTSVKLPLERNRIHLDCEQSLSVFTHFSGVVTDRSEAAMLAGNISIVPLPLYMYGPLTLFYSGPKTASLQVECHQTEWITLIEI